MDALKKLGNKYLIVQYDRTEIGELTEMVFRKNIFDGEKDTYNVFVFDNDNYTEAGAIKAYSNCIESALKEGKTIVHWNQNRYEYGPQHLNRRYKFLTGKDLNLSYGPNQINLAGLLFDVYGDNYIGHPRLTNLGELNGFNIPCEGPRQGFARVTLIVKIFHAAKAGTLKTRTNLSLELEKKQELIDRLKSELKLSQSNERVLDRSEVTELLGISEGTLSNWVKKGEIPYTRIGRRLFFLKSEIIKKATQPHG